MIPVDSSAIEAIGYDAARRELFVRFHAGRTYAYEDVPSGIHQEMMRAESKGAFLNQRIKSVYHWREL